MKELKTLLDEYEEKFGDVFPMFELMEKGVSVIEEMLKNCLEQGKTASEMGYIEYTGDILY